MTELGYVNGVFCPLAEAKVSIEDRGFQFGDGVYEVVAAYGGRPFLLDAHMARLRRSLAAIGLAYDLERDPLEPIINEGLSRSGITQDAMIYIQITRGACPRSHVIPSQVKPTVVMTFKPLPEVPDDLRRRGAKVMTTPETRWSNCYIKAITLLPNVLAKNEAVRRGYDDAVFVTTTGEVRECSAANVFIVNGKDMTIPPRTESILHGVTQGVLLECASRIGLTVTERAFDVETLLQAGEVLMSSTTTEVLGITTVDGQPIGDGTVGPVTGQLYREFKARTRAVAAEARTDSVAR
jgi:D-alanine transaminase